MAGFDRLWPTIITPMPGANPSDRLDSWKAIANYLGRSVRTARRWEVEEALPVHRHMHQSLGSVYAYRSELDRWLKRDQSGPAEPSPQSATENTPDDEIASVVVLPLSYVGSDAGDEYIADGFTDEIIADLSKLHSLRVISRTSSMTLKGSDRDARSLGQELRVSHLLEGTVRRHQTSIRVTVRLVDAASDHTEWSEKFSGEVDDIFEIQEQIAREVAGALELRLSREDEDRLAHKPIKSWPVWQSVVQARQEAMRWDRSSIDRAVERLEHALSITGDSAELYVDLGRTYLQYRETGLDLGPKPLEKAKLCAERAFEADPNSAGGLQLRGWLHYSQGKIQSAVNDLKSALDSNWADPDALGLLCNCYLVSGRVEKARPLFARLLSLDPLIPVYQLLPSWADVLDGRPAEALPGYRRMFEAQPDSPMARLFLVWLLAVNQQNDEAIDLAAGFAQHDADSMPAQVAALIAAALKGESVESPFSRANPDRVPGAEIFPRTLAQASVLAGRNDDAVAWLTIAVDRGFINHPYLDRHDPILTRLKSDPGYNALLKEVHQRWQAFES